jgi:hypothetical protein
MAEVKNEEITAALLLLAAEDNQASEDARAALDWICGEEGLALITQERIQDFCWCELPDNWMSLQEDYERVARSLSRVLDLLELPRYAGICRSETTLQILGAYADSRKKGLAAYRKANTASGICPPDVPELTWGDEAGWQEAAARSRTAEFLELAVASGELVPGQRGWKTRQTELVRTHVTTARDELLGQSFAAAILSERAETWVDGWHSPTRHGIVSGIVNRLFRPASLPDGIGDEEVLPDWRWLLGQLSDGVPLTQAGNLGRAFVQENAERFGWDVACSPSTEDELYDLHQLHELAGQLGLTRRATARTLTLSPKGRRLLANTGQLWHATAGALLPGDGFGEYAGEIFLVMLISGGSVPGGEIAEAVGTSAAEEGFRDRRTYLTPGQDDVNWAIRRTGNLCRALGLMEQDGVWPDRRFEFTPVGTAMALEALRIRATGP